MCATFHTQHLAKPSPHRSCSLLAEMSGTTALIECTIYSTDGWDTAFMYTLRAFPYWYIQLITLDLSGLSNGNVLGMSGTQKVTLMAQLFTTLCKRWFG
jgi:hypothetical protein